MPLVISPDAMADFLAWIADNEVAVTFHAYQNNVTPTIETQLADFTECDFDGYLPILIENWTTPINYGGRAVTFADPIAWEYVGGTTNLIYGYYATGPSGELLWSERDPNAPINFHLLGQFYLLQPAMSQGSAYGSAGVIVMQDDFTDTNGVLIQDHAIAPINTVQSQWSLVSGGIDIQTNQANCTAAPAGPTAQAVFQGRSADGQYTAAGASGQAGVMLRWTDTQNFLWVFYFAGTVYLNTMIAGTQTLLSSIPGYTDPVEVYFRGPQIALVDAVGLQAFGFTTHNVQSNQHGIIFSTVGSKWSQLTFKL